MVRTVGPFHRPGVHYMESPEFTMNQRQTTNNPGNPRQYQPTNNRMVRETPPILFSLPDLSEPCKTTTPVFAKPLSSYSDTVACTPAMTVGAATSPVLPLSTDPKSPQKFSSLLNTAIGFLAFASLLIGLKIYTDRVSERTRANQRVTINSKAPSPNNSLAPGLQQPDARSASPSGIASEPNSNAPSTKPNNPSPAPLNFGPQQANYQAQVSPGEHAPSTGANGLVSTSHDQIDNGSQAVLHIADPVVQASFPIDAPEVMPLAKPTLTPSAVLAANASTTNTPDSPTIQPQISNLSPEDKPVANPIQADSLNTRDMIRLRQGKSIDLVHRERNEKPLSLPMQSIASRGNRLHQSETSDVQLTGETYPPIRQKYEPIGLPTPTPVVSRPTSMEIPEPPKPYQPIGVSLQ